MYQYKEENIGENPINFYVNFTLPLLHKSLSFPFPFCISAHLLSQYRFHLCVYSNARIFPQRGNDGEENR